MTNKEKYKQAFSAVRISDDFYLEVNKMEVRSKKIIRNKLVASVAACVLFIGSSAAIYATDMGGIQRTIQLWLQGDPTDVTVTFDGNGHYDMDYIDSEGNASHQGGGGVAFDEDGTERPLTEEELLEEITMPDVEYKDDGTAWVYWYNQKIDITNRFEDDLCYLKLVKGDETLYMTVFYQDGYRVSPHKFLIP